MLVQGTVLPKQLHLAKESLPAANALPAAPVHHGHELMTFEEPENREGEAFPRHRTLGAHRPTFYPPFPPPPLPSQLQQATFYHQAPPFQPAPPFQWQAQPFQWQAPPLQQQVPPVQQQAPTLHQAHLPPQPRQRAWRLNKAAQEDEERMARGEPPKKRLTKDNYHYTCKECGQEKNKGTGHTQLKGRWYCPASGLTVDQWKNSL